MHGTPLLLPTAIVLLVALFEWRHTRWVSYIALTAAVPLLTAVLRWPLLSAEQVEAVASTWLVVAFTVAKIVGAGCFMWCVVRTIRASGVPW